MWSSVRKLHKAYPDAVDMFSLCVLLMIFLIPFAYFTDPSFRHEFGVLLLLQIFTISLPFAFVLGLTVSGLCLLFDRLPDWFKLSSGLAAFLAFAGWKCLAPGMLFNWPVIARYSLIIAAMLYILTMVDPKTQRPFAIVLRLAALGCLGNALWAIHRHAPAFELQQNAAAMVTLYVISHFMDRRFHRGLSVVASQLRWVGPIWLKYLAHDGLVFCVSLVGLFVTWHVFEQKNGYMVYAFFGWAACLCGVLGSCVSALSSLTGLATLFFPAPPPPPGLDAVAGQRIHDDNAGWATDEQIDVGARGESLGSFNPPQFED